MSQEHWLECLFGLMLGINLASINIISNVCIHYGPIDSCLGQVSHLFNASVVTVQVTECSLIELRGYLRGIHTLFPFSNIPFSMVSSSLVPQKWHAMWGTS